MLRYIKVDLTIAYYSPCSVSRPTAVIPRPTAVISRPTAVISRPTAVISRPTAPYRDLNKNISYHFLVG